MISFGLSDSAVMQGITAFILSAITCAGIFGIFAIITIPIVYTIYPEFVAQFKFISLAPVISVGLYKLDYFVNRAVRYATTKRIAINN